MRVLSGPDLFGWVGGALATMAYVLVSRRHIVPEAALFQGLNMLGAALLCVAAFHSGALPSACLNIAWILFGVQSLVATNRQRRWALPAHKSRGPVPSREAAYEPTAAA